MWRRSWIGSARGRMKKKKFDCVEMKREGAKAVMARTAGMSVAEEVQYWRGRTAAFRKERDAARRAKGRPVA